MGRPRKNREIEQPVADVGKEEQAVIVEQPKIYRLTNTTRTLHEQRFKNRTSLDEQALRSFLLQHRIDPVKVTKIVEYIPVNGVLTTRFIIEGK